MKTTKSKPAASSWKSAEAASTAANWALVSGRIQVFVLLVATLVLIWSLALQTTLHEFLIDAEIVLGAVFILGAISIAAALHGEFAREYLEQLLLGVHSGTALPQHIPWVMLLIHALSTQGIRPREKLDRIWSTLGMDELVSSESK